MTTTSSRRRFLQLASILAGITLAAGSAQIAMAADGFSTLGFTLRWKHSNMAPTPVANARVELISPAGQWYGLVKYTDGNGKCFFDRIPAPSNPKRPFFIRVTWNGTTKIYTYGDVTKSYPFPNNPRSGYNQARLFNTPTGY